jgi:hypothetical protein
MIYHFFEDFRNFNLVDTPNTKRIGKPSANGFIWTVPFLKEGLTVYSVLKCSANETADNLYYAKNFLEYVIHTFCEPRFIRRYDSTYKQVGIMNVYSDGIKHYEFKQ